MIEFMGAVAIAVASGVVMAYFWRRRTFVGGKDVETWGASVNGMPLKPNFTGATNPGEAMADAHAMVASLYKTEE